ncbi:MAG: glycosyltransferase family 2 protein [Roseivivax sp.]|nr:glycosyltransferase family 2 protein [Roseivivax sp.]
MRIVIDIGPDAGASDRVQAVLAAKRARLEAKGVLFARSPGGRGHARLYMASTDPDAPDPLRAARGFAGPAAQAALRDDLARSLHAEIDRLRPELLILSCHHLGAGLHDPAQIGRLHDLLAPYADEIRILAFVEDPARMALRRYAEQVLDGRIRPLSLELSLQGAANWWDAACASRPDPAPQRGLYDGPQTAMHWLDLARLVRVWDGVFGAGATELHGYEPAAWGAERFPDRLGAILGIDGSFGRAEPWRPAAQPPAAFLARARRFNEALLRLMAVRGGALPRLLCRRLLSEMAVDGPPDMAGSLAALSARFAPDLAALRAAHPGLTEAALTPDAPAAPWREAEPRYGFRATQYLAAFLPRLEAALRQAPAADAAPAAPPELSPDAERVMPDLARQKFATLAGTPFAPHNRLGALDETAPAPAFAAPMPRTLPSGSTGRVIVACMKTEAPYILEWIAYHRMIGVDSFVIYTNGCQDTTEPLLQRLAALGVVHHRPNEGWKGKSPQQHALNRAMSDPVITASDWVIHIDVDEFINIRCGNGTLDDFLARAPEGTSHVAMTWRVFGHGGVRRFEDRLVIGQFDACAPRYCPKPHMAWGFKTMGRSIGAYDKLSCHRPNRLRDGVAVRWVNGNAQDITREVARSGWRNTRNSIGYDLLQLNHYPLRSAESFLVKRQRGRALHVDRAIGLNYWIRMDWGGARDTTIHRNIPRVEAEIARLMRDPEVAQLHAEGVAWHKARAQALHAVAEYQDLYAQAVTLSLTDTERAAFALALDLES